MDYKDEKIMDYLILNGALEFAGIDSSTGEILYNITPKMKEVMPDLYAQQANFVNEQLMALWEKGFVDMDILSDSPVVKLNNRAYDDSAIKELSYQEKWSLQEIKRIIG